MTEKTVYNPDTYGQYHKHFPLVTYSPSKKSLTILCMHSPMQCFQNKAGLFVTGASKNISVVE